MGQKKLIKFNQIKTFGNVLEKPEGMAGNWGRFFGNNNPITLELACGKGEYSVGLGTMYPNRNFIGVDIKGNRIWKGAKTALENKLTNVAFLRTEIDQLLLYFAPSEIAEIWIVFPDPQLRFSKAKKRLTHPKFLRMYQQILLPNGLIHLKTDSPQLYQFTQTVINLFDLKLLYNYDDVAMQDPTNLELSIETHYQQLDIAGSNRIHYLQFLVDKPFPIEQDAVLKDLISE
jgi:tRNA (guanine-N7-)-methyltransferase